MVFVLANQPNTQGFESRNEKPEWLGAVTLCSRESSIIRAETRMAAVYGAGLKVNDMLVTGKGAVLSLSVSGGGSVTMAENSQVAIQNSGEVLRFAVIQGEVRVVHGGNQPLELSTSESRVLLNRSIVRLQRTGNKSTVQLIAGSAKLLSSKQVAVGLQAGETYVLTNSQVVTVKNGANWLIDASQVRLASAQQNSPPLTLPAVQKPQSSTAPPNSNPNPSTATTNTPQANSLAEEEERRRLLRVQSQTRGGGNVQTTGNRGGTGTSFTGNSSLGLGSFSGSSGAFSSVGLFADANQQTFQGQVVDFFPGQSVTLGDPQYPAGTIFPGAIHLVTAENNVTLNNVTLNSTERAAIGTQNYYSIGVGQAPMSQVVTDAFTASNSPPKTLGIPQFNAHTVKLEQYGIPEASNPQNGGLNSNIGITGLVGQTPSGPVIIGTAPLVDERAKLNGNATFALGEFRVSTDANGGIAFGIRRSDQDRLIVKDANGNDANDQVKTNTDVNYVDAVDARFLPNAPSVKRPISDKTALTGQSLLYSELSPVRKAALTTIMADTLKDYSNRTGQTRFVIDGNKIIDISGYKP